MEFVVFASRWLNRIFSGLAVVLIALCIIISRWRGEPVSDTERMLQEAAELLSTERFDDAGPLAWEVMRGQTLREEGTLIAARTGARLKRSQPTYRRQSSDQAPAANATVQQRYDHADRLLDAGRIREAEQWFRNVLARDATEAAGIAGNDWTASAAFGDLNGDGFQDLYVVNYLSGPDVFTRKCFHPVGNDRVPVQCSPTLFPAAQDRLYLNLGDGGFADVTIESGIVAPNGKGLALILADFEKTRRLNVFVANDTTANFYFVNRVEQRGEPLRFVEQGVQTGLAYDGAGNAQSSMGVAAGDADQDGRLDLFVTNFSHEVNTLYLHQPGNVFVDGIRESGLAEPGFAMMGWGAQFLDGDLDGLDDLFVANGDLYPTSNPYQMPQQFFHNRGNGRFILGTPETLGTYFTKSWLGRAVARLDVNRDGLPDLAVTHVDSPFALLVNETPRHGKFLRVKLRGVISDRDAIGATVRVTEQGKTWSQQLVGGDGFAVSNERVLAFGLGTTEWIDSISISWPSGADDEYQERIPTDSELLFVEGSHRFVLLNRNL